MQPAIQDDLAPVLRAVQVLSPASFLFQGELVPVAPGPVQPMPGLPNHPMPSTPLLRDLQSVLYARCYSQRLSAEHLGLSPKSFMPDPSFVQKLSHKNRTQARWEGGWMIYAVGSAGQVSLQKGDRQRTAVPGEFISEGPPGVPPRVGSVVSVFVPRESVAAQPGFYFVYSESLSDAWDDHGVLRFYFHTPNEAAPELLDCLTLEMNRYQVPFRLKTLSEPSLYTRTDAAVLYVARRYYEITTRILREIPSTLAAQLRPQAPLFTRMVRPGIGLAEDPNTGESFGMHRCRLTAEGIVDAWTRADQSEDGRMKAVAARFEQNGLNFSKPYLNPGSVDFYEVAETVDFAYA